MQLTTESIQSLLTDLTLVIQFFMALVCFFIILIPLTHTFTFHHDGCSWVMTMTRTCGRQLMVFLLASLAYGKDTLWYPFIALMGWPTTIELVIDRTLHADSICMREDKTILVPRVAGLVNTGNSCYLNSVLQAFSSLAHWHSHLAQQSGHLTDTLLKTLRLLTQPLKTRTIMRPSEIVAAMASNPLLLNHDQQDAQEILQLIVSAIDAESDMITRTTTAIDFEQKHALAPCSLSARPENPFTGLLADRLLCMQCGYTEAVRHVAFNNVQLTLPNTCSATLEECLHEFTAVEYLSDAACRQCTTSRMSSKQVMFAKPPKILCLHLSRSVLSPSGTVYKNACHIQCSEFLDLAPYITQAAPSTPPLFPTPSIVSTSGKSQYRLMAMIVHFGSHNFGHFITYKRRITADSCCCIQCGDSTRRLKPCSEWYRISDDQVDACTIQDVLSANPYMLLYEHVGDEREQDIMLRVNQK